MYDLASALWVSIIAAVLPLKRNVLNAVLWAYHQRFLASLCMSAKVDTVVDAARLGLDSGKCAVNGLQSTGESVAGFDSSDDDDGLSSTADGIVRSFLINHCVQRGMDSESRDDLLAQLEILSAILPANPLDEIIDRLGGPSKVAEMTGRRHRRVRASNGAFRYVARTREGSGAQSINIMERQNFPSGRKLVAIISQAVSTGISL